MFSDDINWIAALFEYYKIKAGENLNETFPTKIDEINFTGGLIQFKRKLSTQNRDYITMMCKSKIKSTSNINLSKIDLEFVNNVVLIDEQSQTQFKYILLTLALLLVDCSMPAKSQHAGYWDALNLLKHFENTSKIEKMSRVLTNKLLECEKEIKRQVDYKNRDNIVFNFLITVRNGGGKYSAFWKNKPIENSIDYSIDNDELNIDHVHNLMKENEYQKTLGTPRQKLILKNNVDSLMGRVTSLKQSSVIPTQFSIIGRPVINGEKEIILLNTHVVKHVGLSTAITKALSSFKDYFKDKFEFCVRDVTMLEELVLFYYKNKSKNNYRFKRTVKQFILTQKNNNKILKTSEIGAISGIKNTNASLKRISKTKKTQNSLHAQNNALDKLWVKSLTTNGKASNPSSLNYMALMMAKHVK